MTKGWSPTLSSHLTELPGSGVPVVGPGGRLIGIVVHDATSDRYVAWTKKRLGDFALKHEAITAVHLAKKTKKGEAHG